MSANNCDICGIWDSGLIDGVCLECVNKYSYNVVEAKEAFDTLIKDPETKIGKLKRIADLARISIVCDIQE